MHPIVHKLGARVAAVLSGFDRLVVRGSLRGLSYVEGMKRHLSRADVPRREFGSYVERVTERLKEASLAEARALGRPVIYLDSAKTRKEAVARRVLAERPVESGLICVLSCVEPCRAFEMRRNAQERRLELVYRTRKCLHLYHYYLDPLFGFLNARIQTWFPFPVQICLNGHDWLARRLDEEGVGYARHENCFTRLEDPARAQRLMDELLALHWPPVLDALAARLNPAQAELLGRPWPYYWTAHQTEWCTDLLFEDPRELARRYPAWAWGAIAGFSTREVFRFLGKRLQAPFQGEAVGHGVVRPEGLCVKHRVDQNAIKMYDKAGCVLRVETTVNAPERIKVYRPAEGGEQTDKAWRPMRKGLADLHRRAQVSQRANERYLAALGDVDSDTTLGQVLTPLCARVSRQGRRVRGLRPWSAEDRELLGFIARPEYLLAGFSNGDLARELFPAQAGTPDGRRAASGKTGYRIRLLRAHGLIRKLPRTRRYRITEKGRQAATALLLAQQATLKQLTPKAA